MDQPATLPAEQERYLLARLRELFSDGDENALAQWRSRLRNVELAAGERLMSLGEAGDSMYLVLSGRLRVFLPDGPGRRAVGEMTRGQFIGEISMFTDQPRAATVIAIRDSVLVRLDKADFPALLAASARASIVFTRHIVSRLMNGNRRPSQVQPVTIGLVPISAGVDVRAFGRTLLAAMAPHGRVCMVDEGVIVAPPPQGRDAAPLSLDDIESSHDFVLLVMHDRPDGWTERCLRQSDEILLLAEATQPPVLHPNEQRLSSVATADTGAAEVLVLLHPDGTHMPAGTAAWLDRRPVADHVHIRPGMSRDVARLARIVTRNAVGLVLSGGGARGMSHLGVWRALHECGIDVDYVGGTSIGSIITSLIAADRPLDELKDIAEEALKSNPTGDVNPVPILSLVKGDRVRRAMGRVVERLFGRQADVEDLWKGAFLVATNYSQASEDVARRGPLQRAILASIAIPGALPPVLRDGDLLCDGGTLNNFPVDIMRSQRGVKRVIGVDLGGTERTRVDLEQVPSHWQLLLDRLRPASRRRYALPSFMGYLINALLLHSMSRQRLAAKDVDLYFKPELGKVGLLEWKKAAEIEARGYEHGRAVLAAMGDVELAAWRVNAGA